MTLTDFLTERIDEDEDAVLCDPAFADPSPADIRTWYRKRLLADCQAKRRIVGRYNAQLASWVDFPEHEEEPGKSHYFEWARHQGEIDGSAWALYDLALAYDLQRKLPMGWRGGCPGSRGA